MHSIVFKKNEISSLPISRVALYCIVFEKNRQKNSSKKLYCIVFEFCIIFKNKKLKSCFVLYYIQKIKFLGFLHIELKLKYCIVLFSKQTKNEKNNMGF